MPEGKILRREDVPTTLLQPMFRVAGTFRRLSTSRGAGVPPSWVPGHSLRGGWTVSAVTRVGELNVTAVEARHEASGARLLHLDADDRNNAFAVAFPTVPQDSTGVAHVLEHVALCGSKRYPVRDPFFNMLRRSMASFMNAFTASDFTAYPFATQDEADYENLLRVYLDAAFFPLLRDVDLAQEGHRLELVPRDGDAAGADAADSVSDVVRTGVVYNEMKGVFSDADSRFYYALNEALFPTITYGNNSGGDPVAIPDLTWPALRDFHATHYHPSNAYFYSYGDMPLEPRLELINEVVLSQFSAIDPGTAVSDEAGLVPGVVRRRGPLGASGTPERIVSVGVIGSHITDTYETFLESLAATLMLQEPQGAVYRALLGGEGTLGGKDFAPATGYSSHTRQATFSLGLRGLPLDCDGQAVEDAIDEAVAQVVRDGFDADAISGVVHQIELSAKRKTAMWGINTSMSLLPTWIHGGNVATSLGINAILDRLRADLERDPQLLQHVVRRLWVENKQKVRLEMDLVEGVAEEESRAEQEQLAALSARLTADDRAEIARVSAELAEEQGKEADKSCLPRLLSSQVPREAVHPQSRLLELAVGSETVPVQVNVEPVNGLVDVRLAFDVRHLPDELRPLLPVFCANWTRLGAGALGPDEFASVRRNNTGGISAFVQTTPELDDLGRFREEVVLVASCLNSHLEPTMNLLREMLTAPRTEPTPLMRSFVGQMANDSTGSVVDSGHSFAMSRCVSSFHPAAARGETYAGLHFVDSLTAFDGDFDARAPAIAAVFDAVVQAPSVRAWVSCEDGDVSAVETQLGGLLTAVRPSTGPHVHAPSAVELPAAATDFYYGLESMKVSHVACAVPTVEAAHADAAGLALVAQLMKPVLHKDIREAGGAYGGGATHGGGAMTFFSYRDPSPPAKTMEAFRKAIAHVSGGSFGEDQVEEARIQQLAALDKPVPPQSIGGSEFYNGMTPAIRQRIRDGVFSATRDSLVALADTYLVQPWDADGVRTAAVIGPKK